MIIINSNTGKYKTDAFNKSNALLLDLSFAKGNADRKKINVIIVTPTNCIIEVRKREIYLFLCII